MDYNLDYSGNPLDIIQPAKVGTGGGESDTAGSYIAPKPEIQVFKTDNSTHNDYNTYFNQVYPYSAAGLSNPGANFFNSKLTDLENDANVDSFKKTHNDMSSNIKTTLKDNKAFAGISFSDDEQLKTLESSRTSAQKALDTIQTKYNGILSGSDPVLSAKKKNVDNLQKAYYDALKNDIAAQKYEEPVRVVNEEIAQTEKSISDLMLERTNFANEKSQLENQIAALDVEITGYDSTITQLDGQIAGFDSEIAALKTQKRNVSDDKDQKVKDEAHNASIDAQIKTKTSQKESIVKQKTDIENKKKAANEKKTKNKEQKDAIQQNIEKINSSIEQEKSNLETLKQQKQKLDEQIKQIANETTKKALDAYNEAKNNYDTEYQKAINDVGSKLNELRGNVNKIEVAIAQRKQVLLAMQKQQKEEEAKKTTEQSGNAGGSGSTDGSGSAGGSGGTSGAGSADGASGSTETQRLQATMNESQQALNSAKSDIISAFDGTSNTLKPIAEKCKIAWEGFIKSLSSKDSALATQLTELKNNFDAKGKEYVNAEKAVIEAGSGVIDKAIAYEKANFELSELESAKTKLDGTDVSSLSSEKKTEVENMKQKLASAIQTKREEVQRLKTESDNANNISALESRRDTLKTEYNNLKNNLLAEMKKAANKYSEVNSYQIAFDAATKEFETKRESEITSKKEAYKSASTKYKESANASNKASAHDIAKEYSVASASGGAIQTGSSSFNAEHWRTQGYNAEMGRKIADDAKNHCPVVHDKGQCGKYVRETLNRLYGTSIANAGKAFQFGDNYLSKPPLSDKFKKYTNPGNLTLNDIPDGSIVIWSPGSPGFTGGKAKTMGHIGIKTAQGVVSNYNEVRHVPTCAEIWVPV